MSPPEVWGPAVWRLIHTLCERLNENAYNALSHQLFNFFVRICKFLPCPECSTDASNFLAKIKISNLKNKTEFKNTFYLFHNWVNAKKRKPLFNYGYINIYGKYRLIEVINDFIAKYQTKGNMKLLTESFQRQLVVKDLKNWLKFNMSAFLPIINIPRPLPEIINTEEEPVIIEEESIIKEEIQNDVIEEPIIIEEQDNVIQEILNNIIEESVVAEEEIQNVAIEESVVVQEEEKIDIIKKKKRKKSKK